MIPLSEFSELAETIKEETKNGPVYYYPSWGNWGDALIHYGTKKFLNDIDLKYEEWNTLRRWKLIVPYLKGGTVIHRGGGGFCDVHNGGEQVVRNLAKRFKVIVLPSTYGHSLTIPNVLFFRRDNFGSKHNVPASNFGHDLAFYLGRQHIPSSQGNGVGYFFRTDGESSNKIPLPSSNVDISRFGDVFTDVDGFFQGINEFSIIHTDRLHVSIAACLLGKEVHLYPGSYFKNMAIYLSSMRNYFDNVYFHKEFDLENHLLTYVTGGV